MVVKKKFITPDDFKVYHVGSRILVILFRVHLHQIVHSINLDINRCELRHPRGQDEFCDGKVSGSDVGGRGGAPGGPHRGGARGEGGDQARGRPRPHEGHRGTPLLALGQQVRHRVRQVLHQGHGDGECDLRGAFGR